MTSRFKLSATAADLIGGQIEMAQYLRKADNLKTYSFCMLAAMKARL
jgi:hypothetical protein